MVELINDYRWSLVLPDNDKLSKLLDLISNNISVDVINKTIEISFRHSIDEYMSILFSELTSINSNLQLILNIYDKKGNIIGYYNVTGMCPISHKSTHKDGSDLESSCYLIHTIIFKCENLKYLDCTRI